MRFVITLYDAELDCPKCKARRPFYRPRYCVGSFWKRCEPDGYEEDEEHIHVDCSHCGFQAVFGCADAE